MHDGRHAAAAPHPRTPATVVRLTARVHGRSYRFGSVREVLGRANEPKSGDALAGIGARSHLERAAAKRVVAELTLEDLRAHPVVPLDDDEVSRVIDAGVEERTYREIRSWSVAELRDWLLDDATTGEAIRATSRGLTAEMAAAVAKLCSNLDLVYGARKMPVRIRSVQIASGSRRSSLVSAHRSRSAGPSSLARSIKVGRADDAEAATLVVLLIFFLRICYGG